MKRIIFTFLVPFIALIVKAQIPDANLESWKTTSADFPAQWNTMGLVTKVSPAPNGSYGCKVQADTNTGELGAVYYGDMSNNLMLSGMHVTTRPDSLVGYFKYDISKGDTAWVIIHPQRNGRSMGYTLYKLTGSQASTFQRIGIKIKYIVPTVIPDTIFIGVTSGNPLDSYFYRSSYVIADNFTFKGVSQAIPNNSFENWNTLSYDLPTGWDGFNYFDAQTVTRSTDAYAGKYAMKIENLMQSGDPIGGTAYTVGPQTYSNSIYTPSFPVSSSCDTFFCYAKFQPQNKDSADIYIEIYKADSIIGSGEMLIGSTLSKYTLIKVPIDFYYTGVKPDSAMIFMSSFKDDGNFIPRGVSALYVDNMSFDMPMVSGIVRTDFSGSFSIYPNPATDKLYLDVKGNAKISNVEVLNIEGKCVISQTGHISSVDIGNLSPGIYTLRTTTVEGIAISKFVKQ